MRKIILTVCSLFVFTGIVFAGAEGTYRGDGAYPVTHGGALKNWDNLFSSVTVINGTTTVRDGNGSLTTDFSSPTANCETFQTAHDNFNANANVQQGNADVATGNRLYVQLSSPSASVETIQTTHDENNCNANMQQGDADVSASNKLHTQCSSDTSKNTIYHGESLPAGTNNIGDVDIDSIASSSATTNVTAYQPANYVVEFTTPTATCNSILRDTGGLPISIDDTDNDAITAGICLGAVSHAVAWNAATSKWSRLRCNSVYDLVVGFSTPTAKVEAWQDTAGDLNCTEASASAIKDAVEIMDDWDSSDYCKTTDKRYDGKTSTQTAGRITSDGNIPVTAFEVIAWAFLNEGGDATVTGVGGTIYCLDGVGVNTPALPLKIDSPTFAVDLDAGDTFYYMIWGKE